MGWISLSLSERRHVCTARASGSLDERRGTLVTIRKALAGKEPPYRRQEKPRAPVMDPVAKIVEQGLLGDRQRPRKQRHTARRVYTRLLEEHGLTGAEVPVGRWVREWKAAHGGGRQEAVVLLDPEPLPTGPLPAELIPGVTDRPVPCSDLSPFNALLPAGAL